MVNLLNPGGESKPNPRPQVREEEPARTVAAIAPTTVNKATAGSKRSRRTDETFCGYSWANRSLPLFKPFADYLDIYTEEWNSVLSRRDIFGRVKKYSTVTFFVEAVDLWLRRHSKNNRNLGIMAESIIRRYIEVSKQFQEDYPEIWREVQTANGNLQETQASKVTETA